MYADGAVLGAVVCREATLVGFVGVVQRQAVLFYFRLKVFVAGALGVGGGLGFDELGRALGFIRREGHGYSPIENHPRWSTRRFWARSRCS